MKIRLSVPLFSAFAILAAAGGLDSATAASVTYTGPDLGKWSTSAFWSGSSVPAVGDDVFILNSGTTDLNVLGNTSYKGAGLNSLLVNNNQFGRSTLIVSKNLVVSGTTAVGSGFAGQPETNGRGYMVQTGGSSSHGALVLAGAYLRDNGAKASYVLEKGNLTVGNLVNGLTGQGLFDQYGGSVRVTNELTMGGEGYQRSEYRLHNGRLTVEGTTVIGVGAAAHFEQTKGTSDLGALVLGKEGPSWGEVTLKGGTMHSRSVSVGPAGAGYFVQDGGTHIIDGNLSFGDKVASGGTYTINGGTAKIGGAIQVRHGSFFQQGGSVSAAGGVQVIKGDYLLGDSTLTTAGLSVAAGSSFSAQGTKSTIRTTGDISFASGGTISTRSASLIVGKGSQISLSAIQADAEASASSLQAAESWGSIKLEKKVTLTLEGDAGVDAIYVNGLDIGSKNPFKVESLIVGNGVNIYYNADLRSNKYLKGATYDLANGGQLIAVHSSTSAGLVMHGAGSLVLGGTGSVFDGIVTLANGDVLQPGGSLSGTLTLELSGYTGSYDEIAFNPGDLFILNGEAFALYGTSGFTFSVDASGFLTITGDWVSTPEITETSGTLAAQEFGYTPATTVPEPGSTLLALLGAAALIARRRVR